MSQVLRIHVAVILVFASTLCSVARVQPFQHARGEMVFVHTDRDVYVAGEDIYFSAYLFDPLTTIPSAISRVVYLEVLNSRNTPVARTRLAVENGISAGSMLLPDTLTTGNYHLRAYTNYMRNQGADNFFSLSLVIFNPFIETGVPEAILTDSVKLRAADPEKHSAGAEGKGYISVTIDSVSVTRQKVVMDIHLDKNSFSLNEKTNISVSVGVSSGLRRKRGFSEEAGGYAIKYREHTYYRNSSIFFAAEDQGPLVTGSLISKQNFNPVSGIMLYLSIPGKSPNFQYAITDTNGEFRFLLPFFEEAREIFIQPADFSDEWIIKLNSPFSDQYSSTDADLTCMTSEFHDWLSKIAINYQITKIFGETLPERRYLEKEVDLPPRFYGVPDREVTLEDYVQLPSMEEVFHELVPGVSFRRQRTGYVFNMTNEITGESIGSPGAVLLDGVILEDHSLIAAIDPEQIEKIDIIRGDYQVGSKVFTGLISVISRKGDLCGLADQINGLRTRYNVLDKKLIPINFRYGENRSPESRLPDFRSTLFWEAGLHPDNEGNLRIEFYTSDFRADYDVVIEGLTDKGVPLSIRRRVIVRER